nr:ECF RNA polymerase sigma factor SigK [Nocardioides perillae]
MSVDQIRPGSAGVPSPEGTPVGGPAADAQRLAALLTRSGQGDERAFAELYDAVSGRAYGLAVRVLRDPSQAEEVVQEALLEVWRTAPRYDAERGSATSWILTIVHRRSVDRVRSAEASTRRDTSYHQQNHAVAHDATAEAAQASLEAHRVRKALTALTPVQREALELAYFGGLTHTEVASTLGLPVGTAKTRIRDGLIRLRDTMGVGQ